jgi:AGCS family alanine or glycine:cation symporter
MVMDSGKFVFGVDDCFPPMSYMNADGELVGFDIDLAREICSRMGVACVMQPITWKDKDAELAERRIDCIASMSVPLQPLENMCLSEAYVNDNLVFVVRGDSRIMWMRDLKGKVLGVQAGSTTFDALQASDLYEDVTVVPLEDNISVLRQVREKKLDVGLVDSLAAFYFIRSNKERYFILPESLSDEDLAIGFRAEDKELRNEVQKILSEMKADGTLGKISQKWFESDIMIVR